MTANTGFFTNFSRPFYDYFYSIKNIRHLRTNNFGYAPVDEEIAAYDADMQYGLQLYKELVQGKPGYLVNSQDIVAEISCGKGGGAEYLVKKFKPVRYIGVDFSRKAIAFCKENYSYLFNLQFICATSQELPFQNNSIDTVINVEASHLYRDTNAFFSEVHRVLKPGGSFLFADYRCVDICPITQLEQEMISKGFSIEEKRTVTPEIYDACLQASSRREELVRSSVPWFLYKYFRHYAILEGTKKFMMLKNGQIIYMMYHLKK